MQELPKELQAYWTFREEMTVEDGLILKATRIVIPPTMQESVLQQLHDGHLGFTKCYNRAKQNSVLAKPQKGTRRLGTQLSIVPEAQQNLNQNQHQALAKRYLLFPGQNLQVTFPLQNDSYLLIVDFTSRFPVVCKLKSITAKHVASHFSQVFSEYGWPDTLLTTMVHVMHHKSSSN